MATRGRDGKIVERPKPDTVSLHEANLKAREADREARKERDGLERVAHQAVRNAFRSPLADGRREQKPLRG